jgi:hypothetical protein
MTHEAEPFSESASVVRRDGTHRLAMLAIVPGAHVVVWTYTLSPDLVGTWDDTRHVFATWQALHAHFASTDDAPLMAELHARCETATTRNTADH